MGPRRLIPAGRGVARMFLTRAALLRLSRTMPIPMTVQAAGPRTGMAGEADSVPPLREASALDWVAVACARTRWRSWFG